MDKDGTVSAAETNSAVDYSAMPEYSSYAEVIGDTAATHDGNGNYALYDIDQDGTKELIISFGESDADWTNYVYTLENGKPELYSHHFLDMEWIRIIQSLRKTD